MSKTTSQKIIKVGNSYAITLNKEFVEKTKLHKQSQVSVRYDQHAPQAICILRDSSEFLYDTSKKLSKEEKAHYLASEITPEFQTWVQQTLEEDKESMRTLANI